MTYEEKYNKAIDVIKKIKEANKDNAAVVDFIEYNYPELKEDEDEKIRKELIEQVVYIVPNDDEIDSEGNVLPIYQKRIDKYLAWLEKQGEKISTEQKPVEWSEEDEHRRTDAVYFLETAKKHYASTIEIDATIEWLKSLKSHPHWKPSEEQMDALRFTKDYLIGNTSRNLNSLYNDLKKL